MDRLYDGRSGRTYGEISCRGASPAFRDDRRHDVEEKIAEIYKDSKLRKRLYELLKDFESNSSRCRNKDLREGNRNYTVIYILDALKLMGYSKGQQ